MRSMVFGPRSGGQRILPLSQSPRAWGWGAAVCTPGASPAGLARSPAELG